MNPDNRECRSSKSLGLAGYQAAISEAYAPMRLHAERGDQKCDWTVSSIRLAAFTLSHVAYGGAVHARVPADSQDSSKRKIVLMCVEKGSVNLADGDRHSRCDAQKLMLMNVGRALDVWQPDAADILSATMPTQSLSDRCPEIEQRCGLVVSASSGTAAVLADLIKSIRRERSSIDIQEARVLSDLISTMVSCIFRGDQQSTLDWAIIRDYHERIRQVIEEELQNPKLSPGLIAERLEISQSYLFSMARKGGMSIEQEIINKRLERCRECLMDPNWAQRSLADIALTWGFKELSHFSRRFSQRFGRSPRAFRHPIDLNRA
jgi:AraC-like DNA-binding protein